MDVTDSIDRAASGIAAAIGDPARARILYCLMDGRARTGTELSAVANVGTSTASAHLDRLVRAHLVAVVADGRHRYYSLAGPGVAHILEGLTAIAGEHCRPFIPSTPSRLRLARTCYDHLAGSLGVRLHDRLLALGWISVSDGAGTYSISPKGLKGLQSIGIQMGALGESRRRAAYGCLDWSERRHHLAGALGAAILKLACERKWLIRDLDGRGLSTSAFGRRELRRCFGLETED
jgi:DNA-binding transcriptional ArsR family regulator